MLLLPVPGMTTLAYLIMLLMLLLLLLVRGSLVLFLFINCFYFLTVRGSYERVKKIFFN